jgi:hypothetical protein
MVLLNEQLSFGYSDILHFSASCLNAFSVCAINHTVGLSFADLDDEILDTTPGAYCKNSSCTSPTNAYTQVCLCIFASF